MTRMTGRRTSRLVRLTSVGTAEGARIELFRAEAASYLLVYISAQASEIVSGTLSLRT